VNAGVRAQDVRTWPENVSREASMLPVAAPPVRLVVGSELDAEADYLRGSLPRPPGDFVLAEYASDCARFVAESKHRARRRAEARLASPQQAYS
jgi:hypothetical protein